jgi:hypothetical protein
MKCILINEERERENMRKEVTVAQPHVLFQDSPGGPEKNGENVTNSEADV